ncbi:unnamed protein product [Porites lobata]|uniref:Uncharacterized protein n=1 Tax=Porites lobata TaxID=104759 RepID=A0ABN8QMH9_9CNID|nr:unnamed protein product [Porites lobata]
MDTVKTVDGQSQRKLSSLAFEEVSEQQRLRARDVLCMSNQGTSPKTVQSVMNFLTVDSDFYCSDYRQTIDRAANWETNTSSASKPQQI